MNEREQVESKNSLVQYINSAISDWWKQSEVEAIEAPPSKRNGSFVMILKGQSPDEIEEAKSHFFKLGYDVEVTDTSFYMAPTYGLRPNNPNA